MPTDSTDLFDLTSQDAYPGWWKQRAHVFSVNLSLESQRRPSVNGALYPFLSLLSGGCHRDKEADKHPTKRRNVGVSFTFSSQAIKSHVVQDNALHPQPVIFSPAVATQPKIAVKPDRASNLGSAPFMPRPTTTRKRGGGTGHGVRGSLNLFAAPGLREGAEVEL
ncbi:hypothetical protein GALMADRAFT_139626 [Galerina marginata CBS 339.88]|uniref:Uncharacterized protein n=1 Tax=Galerina marginata (strain CBS 339.88) TaxID=685588 RepID=A0A067T321_GALM3|nr:hypothetical protein GALMADRAFT_139626 [Galerina marginata CBS 339.88]